MGPDVDGRCVLTAEQRHHARGSRLAHETLYSGNVLSEFDWANQDRCLYQNPPVSKRQSTLDEHAGRLRRVPQTPITKNCLIATFRPLGTA